MYEFWHDYVNPKYGKKTKLYYIDTDNFTVYVKTNDICNDIAENVETGFDKVISAMKDELGGKIMIKFIGLRTKTYIYLIDDGSEEKRQKSTKIHFI